MTEESHIDLARLLTLLEDDREILEHLIETGVLERAEAYDVTQAELARVARTLVRDLEVNWAGVEIILRLRGEILDTRRQVTELLGFLSVQMQSRSG